MPTVACPACRREILDDGSLAGQLVQCPHCSTQMRMPAPPLDFSTARPTTLKRRAKSGVHWMNRAMLVVTCGWVVLLALTAILSASTVSDEYPWRRGEAAAGAFFGFMCLAACETFFYSVAMVVLYVVKQNTRG